jgi:hypothetical protein
MFNDFWNGSLDLQRLNFAMLTLIPKEPDAKNMKKFRPISLCNCSFKIFSKVLMLGKVIGRLISLEQSTFIRGRYILESVVVTHEVVHSIHKSQNPGVVLKVDYEKAYDRVQSFFYQPIFPDFSDISRLSVESDFFPYRPKISAFPARATMVQNLPTPAHLPFQPIETLNSLTLRPPGTGSQRRRRLFSFFLQIPTLRRRRAPAHRAQPRARQRQVLQPLAAPGPRRGHALRLLPPPYLPPSPRA